MTIYTPKVGDVMALIEGHRSYETRAAPQRVGVTRVLKQYVEVTCANQAVRKFTLPALVERGTKYPHARLSVWTEAHTDGVKRDMAIRDFLRLTERLSKDYYNGAFRAVPTARISEANEALRAIASAVAQ